MHACPSSASAILFSVLYRFMKKRVLGANAQRAVAGIFLTRDVAYVLMRANFPWEFEAKSEGAIHELLRVEALFYPL